MDRPESEPASGLMGGWPLLADALDFGLIVLDGDARVAFWNDWVARHSRIAPAQAQGLSLSELFGADLSRSFGAALRNVLQHRLPVVLSNVLHRSPLPLLAPGRPVEDARRLPHSITIKPLRHAGARGGWYFLIQITDNSAYARRESVLQNNTERLTRQATVDGLTGAYNRNYFDQHFRSEIDRARRQRTALSLILLDIDFFKNYNDAYGHPAGDRVLRVVVDALKAQLSRSSDRLARYGGEEFVAVLPNCNLEGARQIAERLRQSVVGLGLPHRASSVADHITISLGVAGCEAGQDAGADALLKQADVALYRSKNGGRNTVTCLTVA